MKHFRRPRGGGCIETRRQLTLGSAQTPLTRWSLTAGCPLRNGLTDARSGTCARWIEQAQLDLPLPPDVTDEGFGFGLEYVLLQRAVLGCKIDGGQHKIGGYTAN